MVVKASSAGEMVVGIAVVVVGIVIGIFWTKIGFTVFLFVGA